LGKAAARKYHADHANQHDFSKLGAMLAIAATMDILSSTPHADVWPLSPQAR
jgi:hypothetical protein